MGNKEIKYPKLKAFIAENGIKQKEIAELLKIEKSTLSSKLNNKSYDFTINEVRKICEKYNLSADNYFLIPYKFLIRNKNEGKISENPIEN